MAKFSHSGMLCSSCCRSRAVPKANWTFGMRS
jgi:hypothetical protein